MSHSESGFVCLKGLGMVTRGQSVLVDFNKEFIILIFQSCPHGISMSGTFKQEIEIGQIGKKFVLSPPRRRTKLHYHIKQFIRNKPKVLNLPEQGTKGHNSGVRMQKTTLSQERKSTVWQQHFTRRGF